MGRGYSQSFINHNQSMFESLERRCLLSASLAPVMTAQPLVGSFPAGHAAPVGFSPAQLKHAYGIDSIKFAGAVVGDGSGQTIAIISAYDNPRLVSSTSSSFAASDLHKFDLQFNLPDPPSFRKVDQDGGTIYPNADSSWANESALDVEWVHAIAPKANILLVEADSPQLSDLISSAVQYARTAPGVSVVTMSFAAGEADGETYYDPTFTTPSNHAGVTFVAASGDAGDPGGYPAFSPNVVAVGATALTLNSGNYGSETGRANSGGGISAVEPKPGYQNNLSISNSMRTIPDVAMDGEPNTGVAVYDSYNGGSNPWYEIGGTSLSSPLWAGIIGITNQGRARAGMPSLDGPTQTLPGLYNISNSDFHDITTGNNGASAKVGYDLVTGLGTPKANLLVPDLGSLASLSGTVHNGNSVLSNVTVYIDLHNTGKYTSDDPSARTNSSGNYTLTDLRGGSYVLRQMLPNGYQQTAPGSNADVKATLSPGQVGTGFNFTDSPISAPTTGSISGNLFNDISGDGIRQNGESNLKGRVFYEDLNKDGKLDNSEPTAVTDANGNYKFAGLAANKTYRIRESLPNGWRPSSPSAWYYDVTIGNGTNVTGKNFSDTQKPGIYGSVFNDVNGNGQKNNGDNALSGWTLYLDLSINGGWATTSYKSTTNSVGNFSFGTMPAGTYRVRIGAKTGYKQTTPAGGTYTVKLGAGQISVGRLFGEKKLS